MQSSSPTAQEWFGHPRGLSTLFFTELWERLSYYGMRAILVLFMVAELEGGGFGMTDGVAAAIYGLYTAGVYLTALPGGWIADRLIGQQKAIFWGGVIIAAGHFTMAIPMLPGTEALSKPSFFAGLVLIVIGTGLLKPNVSSIVGDLYEDKGARRDAGFSLFYMGINIGAFAGPLLCGWLAEEVDWHLGFGAAGIGMVAGLIQYKLGSHHLGTAGLVSDSASAVAARRGDWTKLWAGVGALLATTVVLFFAGDLGVERLAGYMTYVILTIIIGYFGYVMIAGGLTRKETNRVFVIFLLFLGAAMFWSGFEQAGSSMNLFAERYTDRMIGSWELPTSWLQSVNPLFIIIMSPIFGWLWIALASRAPSIPLKFGLGLLLLGGGFMVLSLGSQGLDLNGDGVSPMWLVVTYFLHTCGELCLSPVGLSSVTKLSPKRYVSQMMGTWFMGSALGNLIAGLVAGRIEGLPPEDLFRTVAMIVMVAGVAYIVFTVPIKKLIGDLAEDDLQHPDTAPYDPVDEVPPT